MKNLIKNQWPLVYSCSGMNKLVQVRHNYSIMYFQLKSMIYLSMELGNKTKM